MTIKNEKQTINNLVEDFEGYDDVEADSLFKSAMLLRYKKKQVGTKWWRKLVMVAEL